MPYRVLWRVAGDEALDFWSARLSGDGVQVTRSDSGSVLFSDPEGLEHELLVDDVPDAPLVADADGIPPEHALRGFAGVRAYAAHPDDSAPLLAALGFAGGGNAWVLAGHERRGSWTYDAPPGRGVQGAGTIHHVAWSAADERRAGAPAQDRRRCRRAADADHRPPVLPLRGFREPSGVLFELASRDVGFDVDEPLDALGHGLMLPPQHESRREELQQRLTPISNPRVPA